MGVAWSPITSHPVYCILAGQAPSLRRRHLYSLPFSWHREGILDGPKAI